MFGFLPSDNGSDQGTTQPQHGIRLGLDQFGGLMGV